MLERTEYVSYRPSHLPHRRAHTHEEACGVRPSSGQRTVSSKNGRTHEHRSRYMPSNQHRRPRRRSVGRAPTPMGWWRPQQVALIYTATATRPDSREGVQQGPRGWLWRSVQRKPARTNPEYFGANRTPTVKVCPAHKALYGRNRMLRQLSKIQPCSYRGLSPRK